MKKISIACLMLVCGGCSFKSPPPPAQTVHYQCGTTPLTVTVLTDPQQAKLILDGRQLSLPLVASTSGKQYSDGQYVLLTQGDRAFVQRGEKIVIDDCVTADRSGK